MADKNKEALEQKKQSLMQKFAKSTELAVTIVEDDSSGDGTEGNEGTQVKILHLQQPVNAVGSNPLPSGGEMKVSGAKVYVAAEDIDKFWENVEEKDGILLYKGPMHLDVSKPNGRTVNGQFQITKPAKIWLTSVKFSRRGGQLRQGQQNNLSTMLNTMFDGGKKTFDLAAETVTAAGNNAGAGEEKKDGPKVVQNKETVGP